jgi:hypothetical protein
MADILMSLDLSNSRRASALTRVRQGSGLDLSKARQGRHKSKKALPGLAQRKYKYKQRQEKNKHFVFWGVKCFLEPSINKKLKLKLKNKFITRYL